MDTFDILITNVKGVHTGPLQHTADNGEHERTG